VVEHGEHSNCEPPYIQLGVVVCYTKKEIIIKRQDREDNIPSAEEARWK
jgi:hypothetical protein